MDEVRRALQAALPGSPAALDLAAVRRRGRALRRRRALLAGVAGLAVLTSVTGVALASGGAPAEVLLPAAPEPGAATRTVSLVVGRTPVSPAAPPSVCDDWQGLQREVPLSRATPEGVLRELFGGLTAAERSSGAASVFTPATAELLRSVRVADGAAYVDLDGSLRDRIDLRRTGCSNGFGEQVALTLRQFPGIGPVHHAFDGDPRDFVRWAGGSCPQRPEPGGACDPTAFRRTAPSLPEPAPSPATYDLVLHFSGDGRCDATEPVTRQVHAPPTPLRALRDLFRGPTEEEERAGARSLFSAATQDLLRSVRVERRTAYVDLHGELQQQLGIASTSCGGALFRAEIAATLRAFGVDEVVHAWDGDARAFLDWQQYGCPEPSTAGDACDPVHFSGGGSGTADEVEAPPPDEVAETDEFGVVRAVRRTSAGLELDVDRVRMLGGEQAEAAAAFAGQDYSADYFLVNDSPRTRTYGVPASVTITLRVGPDPRRATLEEFAATAPTGQETLFHLDVEDGVVVGIEQQYRP